MDLLFFIFQSYSIHHFAYTFIVHFSKVSQWNNLIKNLKKKHTHIERKTNGKNNQVVSFKFKGKSLLATREN